MGRFFVFRTMLWQGIRLMSENSSSVAQGGAPLRTLLEKFYLLCGVLAGVFIVGIAALVMVQVAANAIDRVAQLITGTAIGLMVPSYAEFTGFFLVGASFLALPYAFHHGAHIRVGLVLGRLSAGPTRVMNLVCLLVALGLTSFAGWYSVQLMLDSLEFGDMSSGLVPVPLWVPQAGMALGLIGLAIAVLDDLIVVLAGKTPAFDAIEVDPASSSFER